jgi:uncharacterized SAM-binding protein YcdF (DUF218 family)
MIAGIEAKACMDLLLSLKPIITALFLPATSGLLLLLATGIWAWRRSPVLFRSGPRLPLACAGLAFLAIWLFSCQAVAIWLSLHLLPQVSPITADELKRQQVQAIVILGGGVENDAVEYAGAVLTPDAMSRLLYGVYLSRSAQLPMAYSGGKGWGGLADQPAEADVAALSLTRLGAHPLRWQENQSRDTRENAMRTASLLKAEGITHIALVTHAWHMPRSVRQFEAAGLRVTPAPMGYIRSDETLLGQWLPSGAGLRNSGRILKEWLGLWLA